MKTRVWFVNERRDERACLDFESSPIIPRIGEFVDDIECDLYDGNASGKVTMVQYMTCKHRGYIKMIIYVFLE